MGIEDGTDFLFEARMQELNDLSSINESAINQMTESLKLSSLSNMTSREYHRLIVSVAARAMRSGELNSEILWVDSLVEAGVSKQMILAAWDLKDAASRTLRENHPLDRSTDSSS